MYPIELLLYSNREPIYIYNFDDLRLIDAIEICLNTKGLVALNPDPENAVLATPDKTLGNVRVNAYEKK